MTGARRISPPPSGTRRAGSFVVEVVRITDACTACGACLATCPERALRRAPKRPVVQHAACTACWACIEICPAGAILEAVVPAGAAGLLPESRSSAAGSALSGVVPARDPGAA